MSVELEQLTKEFNENVKRLQDENSKGNSANLTMIKNLEESLAKYEAKNQELVLKQAEEKKKSEELTLKLEEIERKMVEMPSVKCAEFEKQEKAFELFIKHGEKMPSEQKGYLRTDSNVDGGFLITPATISNRILKKIEETSPIRRLASVERISSSEWLVDVEAEDSDEIQWIGETEEISETNQKYEQISIFLHDAAMRTVVSRIMLQDSAFNIVQELINRFGRKYAKCEGKAFLKGTGLKQPEGIITSSKINSVTSSVASELKYADLVDLYSSIKSGYNGIFGMSRKTVGYIMKNIVDGMGRPIWNAGNLAAGIPNTILGQPYVEIPDLSDPVANAYSTSDVPVIFGDFAAAYKIIDGVDDGITRDDLTKLQWKKVVFQMSKRMGGKIVMGEAMTKLVIQ
jgi:HK97 family phage major capsid protein